MPAARMSLAFMLGVLGGVVFHGSGNATAARPPDCRLFGEFPLLDTGTAGMNADLGKVIPVSRDGRVIGLVDPKYISEFVIIRTATGDDGKPTGASGAVWKS